MVSELGLFENQISNYRSKSGIIIKVLYEQNWRTKTVNEIISGASDYRLLIRCIILSLRVVCFEYELHNSCLPKYQRDIRIDSEGGAEPI